jgi:murein DD-endopeptidase MepM/ murein hydrolase activator NlpD
MEGFGLSDISSGFSEVLSFLSNFLKKKNKLAPSQQNVSKKESPVRFENQQYQAPIKEQWFNSGDYSPDRPTDSKHPKGHKGIDMRAPGGTAIYPMTSGKVTNVGTDPMGGNIVNIDHGNGIRTYYAHLGTITARKGDIVSNNSQIGTVGESGNAKGTVPHCHFQVWVDGQITNPSRFFSVPKYTPIAKSEQRWLPGQEDVAKNWSVKEHLSQRYASVDDILVKCDSFLKKASK